VEQEIQRLRQGWIERDRTEGNIGIHQKLLRKICVDSRVSRDEFEKLESRQDLSYQTISRNSMACKIPRIG
jgi:hypothetical protein